MSEQARCFLLTGMPKSGTTYLMRLLDELPGVLCRGEGRFFTSHLQGVPSLREGLAGGLAPWLTFLAHRKRNWLGLDAELRTLECENVLEPGVLERSLEQQLDRLAGLAAGDLMRSAAAREPGIALVGDKTPLIEPEVLRAMRAALPDTPIVYLERDPRDTIVSTLFHHARSLRDERADAGRDFISRGEVERVEAHLAAPEGQRPPFVTPDTAARLARAWRACRDEALAQGAAHPELLRLWAYEDLLVDPTRVLSEVLAFLGYDVQGEALEKAVHRNDRAAVARGADGALREHVRSGEPGEWRRWLDGAALAAIASATGVG